MGRSVLVGYNLIHYHIISNMSSLYITMFRLLVVYVNVYDFIEVRLVGMLTSQNLCTQIGLIKEKIKKMRTVPWIFPKLVMSSFIVTVGIILIMKKKSTYDTLRTLYVCKMNVHETFKYTYMLKIICNVCYFVAGRYIVWIWNRWPNVWYISYTSHIHSGKRLCCVYI